MLPKRSLPFLRNPVSVDAGRLELDNVQPRVALVLGADCSTSTGANGAIDQINAGVAHLTAELQADPMASQAVEILIKPFGAPQDVAEAFVSIRQFRPPVLRPGGDTPMAQAMLQAADAIVEQLSRYAAAGIEVAAPPLALFLTDGQPNDYSLFAKAASRVADLEERGEATFLALYTEGADPRVLSQLFVRPPLPINALKIVAAFRTISRSLRHVSRRQLGSENDLAGLIARELGGD